MIVQLSGGHEAELRDKIKGGDYRVAREAVRFHVDADGVREVTMSLEDSVKRALLGRMIARWDVPGLPVPREAADMTAVFDELDIEDQEALYEAIDPVYDKVLGIKDPKSRSSSNGGSPTTSSDEPAAP